MTKFKLQLCFFTPFCEKLDFVNNKGTDQPAHLGSPINDL